MSAVQVSDVLQIVSLAFKSQYTICQVIDLDENMKMNDERYVGLYENYEQLKTREWIYGKTPKFELNILGTNLDIPNTLKADEDIPFNIIVEKGIIQKSQHPNFKEGRPFYDAIFSSGICKN